MRASLGPGSWVSLEAVPYSELHQVPQDLSGEENLHQVNWQMLQIKRACWEARARAPHTPTRFSFCGYFCPFQKQQMAHYWIVRASPPHSFTSEHSSQLSALPHIHHQC